jgi:putative membrane protein
MIGFGLALAGVAAAIHVYIFVMESLTWTSARTRATFGTSREEAEATKELAFNQGFYNLFLAVLVVLGIVLYATDRQDVGLTLVVAGAGSMVAAGLVLILSSPSKARAALVQLVPPLLGVVGVVVGLTS